MKKRDLIVSVILFAIVIETLIATRELPIGSLSSPHVGFFPLVVAVLLGILSLILFVQALKIKSIMEIPKRMSFGNLKAIIPSVGFLFLFAIFFESLGYLISTFYLMAFLLRMHGTKKWWMAIIYALCATGCSYLIFDILLKAQLPRGLLEI